MHRATCTRSDSFGQDPIGFKAGDANLYRYVGNGPGNGIDPDGLDEDDLFAPLMVHNGSREQALRLLDYAIQRQQLQKRITEEKAKLDHLFSTLGSAIANPIYEQGESFVERHINPQLNVLRDLRKQEAAIVTQVAKEQLDELQIRWEQRPGGYGGGIGLEGAESVIAAMSVPRGHAIESSVSPLDFLGGGVRAALGVLAKEGSRRAVVAATVRGTIEEAVPIPLAPVRGAKWFDDVASAATRNADRDILVLGHFARQGSSYQKVAAHYRATYFKVDDWNAVTKGLSQDEIWRINETFLDQQLRQGKKIIFSHNPLKARPNSFFEREVDYLRELGYSFKQKNQWTWEAVR